MGTAGQKHAPGTRVRYSNGVEAVVQENGSHVIVGSSPEAAANARAAGRYSKQVGPKAAARAFNKYYSTRAYKSTRARKAAITRDLCKRGKNQTTTTSYTKGKTGVRRYDYPGMDDGSRCPQRGGKRRGRKVKGSCGMNPDTNRCARGFSNEHGWCELGGKKGTRKSPNMKRRCVANPLARRFLGMPKAKKASPKPRRSKRLAKKAAKKSPKKAKKSPKKAKKSPKKARKSPKKKQKRTRNE